VNADEKFILISEAQKLGVSETCKKYGISRTLYYRWLNRYKAQGYKGLDSQEKNFIPVNKTSDEIVALCLSLIKNHPLLGPREIKYMLESIPYSISESAVYNIMRRNNLSTRAERIKFSKKRDKKTSTILPLSEAIQDGEFWLFWTTHYGDFEEIGPLFEVTIYDYRSHIACTRLYNTLDLGNYIDLLTAVAIPIAQTLHIAVKTFCFFDDYAFKEKNNDYVLTQIQDITKDCGYTLQFHVLQNELATEPFQRLRQAYTQKCLGYLIPLIHQGLTFSELKRKMQHYLRDYNINFPNQFSDFVGSPVENYVTGKNTHLVLPLWAYIDRDY
jgi:transposase